MRQYLTRSKASAKAVTTTPATLKNDMELAQTNFEADKTNRELKKLNNNYKEAIYGLLGANIKQTPSTLRTVMRARPLDEFVYFPKLPTEVRDMIWKLALPGEREIILNGFEEHQYGSPGAKKAARQLTKRPSASNFKGFRTYSMPITVDIGSQYIRYEFLRIHDPRPQSLLQVNRESRDVASKVYTLCCWPGPRGLKFWIDLEHDTVRCDTEIAFTWLSTSIDTDILKKKLRNLTVRIAFYMSLEPGVAKYQNLKHLSIESPPVAAPIIKSRLSSYFVEEAKGRGIRHEDIILPEFWMNGEKAENFNADLALLDVGFESRL